MYWRGKSAERFVRPVRWMVTLLDGEVVPVEFAGIRAGGTSEGHRILSSGALAIRRPPNYVADSGEGSVVASAAEREQRIRKALDAADSHRFPARAGAKTSRCSTPSST